MTLSLSDRDRTADSVDRASYQWRAKSNGHSFVTDPFFVFIN